MLFFRWCWDAFANRRASEGWPNRLSSWLCIDRAYCTINISFVLWLTALAPVPAVAVMVTV
jgi:hypothetical protein